MAQNARETKMRHALDNLALLILFVFLLGVIVANVLARPMRRRIVRVCAWCPDGKEKTDRAIAKGFDVTHCMCKKCARDMES